MKPITRMFAALAMTAAVIAGGATTANAASTADTGIQAEGQVSCGYDFDKCHLQWFEYGFVKNYIVSKIYYRGGGYHFYWWN